MLDIQKPKFDPIAFGTPEKSRGTSGYSKLIHDFGRFTTDDGLTRMDSSYHRPSFYEIEKGRGTTIIDMDARGDITVPSGEERRIATFGLGGCNAVASSGELPDGTRKGYVQHYSPLNHQLGASMLAEATDRFAKDGATNVRAVVMTPGEYSYTQDPSPKWTMTPSNELTTRQLALTVQANINDVDVQLYPYSMNHMSGRYGQGTLMVEFLADGSVNILAEAMPVKPVIE